MKKVGTFLCGIATLLLVTGCGATVPDLTDEENSIISEYAAGVLLKYDKNYSSRLVDTSEYNNIEEETETVPEEQVVPEEEPAEEPENNPVADTEVIDNTEEVLPPATIEEYYGISGFDIQYTGYEVTSSYPETAEGVDMFFAMDATDGTQLLVLKFSVTNRNGADQNLNMLGYGARFRVSVNGEASKGALATMLLNDIQTYNDTIPAGASVELVSVVEIPSGTNVETIDFIMRGGESDATLKLQ